MKENTEVRISWLQRRIAILNNLSKTTDDTKKQASIAHDLEIYYDELERLQEKYKTLNTY